MNKLILRLLINFSFLCLLTPGFAQPNRLIENSINASDLESYVSFLSSPLLKGRMNGSNDLQLATRFIASQAKLLGLQPVNGESFFQPFTLVTKSFDPVLTTTRIFSDDTVTTIKKPFFQLAPLGVSDVELEGEVVFAGYGINSTRYSYNDFENITAEGKILMIMNRAPQPVNGNNSSFGEPMWGTINGLYSKLSTLFSLKAKAILIVMDPKSGFKSLTEMDSGLAEYLSTSNYLHEADNQELFYPGSTRVIYIDREVADELLKGTGYNLTALQDSIDTKLQPHSFLIEGKNLKISSEIITETKELNNVAAIIEGSNPVLKNEVIVFTAHVDHIGISEEGMVYAGADDNASGCAALLEIAQTFSQLKKKPLRSVLFLWVSGEEIGLLGSETYVNNPLLPLAKTVANINVDMIGRTKGIADTTADNPMTGPASVFVISDDQSTDLKNIASDIDKKSDLNFDYSLSDRNHPLNILERSDQYNFLQNGIPVLMFTTGLHTTYHTPDDTIDKIDFNKLELITKDIFRIGYIVANRKNRITVDNPY